MCLGLSDLWIANDAADQPSVKVCGEVCSVEGSVKHKPEAPKSFGQWAKDTGVWTVLSGRSRDYFNIVSKSSEHRAEVVIKSYLIPNSFAWRVGGVGERPSED